MPEIGRELPAQCHKKKNEYSTNSFKRPGAATIVAAMPLNPEDVRILAFPRRRLGVARDADVYYWILIQAGIEP
jgi:hypothetical protein